MNSESRINHSSHPIRYQISRLVAAAALGVLLLLVLDACKRRRPYGYLKLGLVRELAAEETPLPDLHLLLRRDNRGFYVMSTLCAKDLTPLERVKTDTGYVFESQYSDSRYDERGRVLAGPTKDPLPYYQLVLDRSSYDGPIDTLFVKVGTRKPPDWRLPIAVQPQTAGPRPASP